MCARFILAAAISAAFAQLSNAQNYPPAAGAPAPPQTEGTPTSLPRDTEASSYLIFFLDNRRLGAGDIPQSLMVKSILLAANRQQEKARAGQVSGTAAPPPVQQPPIAEQAMDARQGSAYEPGIAPLYPDVNDGYYYPVIGVPIIILPGEDSNV